MKVSCNTRISDIIKADIRAIEAISELNAHFRKLKNPVLRKLLAPRVTVEQAADIGKVPVSALLNKLRELNFEIEESAVGQEPDYRISNAEISDADHVLDVRPILAGGQDPLNAIMQSVKMLSDGQKLLLVNSFEPIPLIGILQKKGYTCLVRKVDENLVHTFITPGKSAINEEAEASLDADFDKVYEVFRDNIKEIDVRGLPMPEPMIKILEELENLQNNQALFVYHKKIPHFLLPELKERGWDYFIRENSENDVHLLICKP